MTRLARVELRRLVKRRLFRLMMAGLFLTVAAILVVNGALSNRNLAAARAKAEAQAAQVSSTLAKRIPLDPACGGPVTVTPAPPKDESGPVLRNPCVIPEPTAADFYSDPRFSFAGNATHLVIAAVALVSLLGFVIGTGFIGAEWTAGTFPLLLTWEPRRARVLGAKLAALIATFVAVGVVTIGVLLAGGWLIAATRGTTAGTNALVRHQVLWYSLRGLVVIVLLSGAGAAVAGLTRHTAAALVGAVGYMVIFELAMRHLHPQWERWLLTTNAGALVGGWVHVEPIFGPERRFNPPPVYTLHADRALLYLGILFVGVIGAWAIGLLRRDVDEAGR